MAILTTHKLLLRKFRYIFGYNNVHYLRIYKMADISIYFVDGTYFDGQLDNGDPVCGNYHYLNEYGGYSIAEYYNGRVFLLMKNIIMLDIRRLVRANGYNQLRTVDGHFKNGILDGFAKKINPNGNREGMWLNGHPIGRHHDGDAYFYDDDDDFIEFESGMIKIQNTITKSSYYFEPSYSEEHVSIYGNILVGISYFYSSKTYLLWRHELIIREIRCDGSIMINNILYRLNGQHK